MQIMIDLKELEASVDALLESETSESMSQWLKNHRCKSFTSLLGSGETMTIGSLNAIFYSSTSQVVRAKANSNKPGTPNNYSLAA